LGLVSWAPIVVARLATARGASPAFGRTNHERQC
jgi:hypothetical protein